MSKPPETKVRAKAKASALDSSGYFAHRRRNDGLSAVIADELGHFGGAAALERENAKPRKTTGFVRAFHR